MDVAQTTMEETDGMFGYIEKTEGKVDADGEGVIRQVGFYYKGSLWVLILMED